MINYFRFRGDIRTKHENTDSTVSLISRIIKELGKHIFAIFSGRFMMSIFTCILLNYVIFLFRVSMGLKQMPDSPGS